MKNISAVVIGFVAALLLVAVAGYVGLPHYFNAATAEIHANVKAFDARLQSVEAFIKKEQEAREANQLTREASAAQIVDRINATVKRVGLVEEALKKQEASFKEEKTKIQDNHKAVADKLQADLEEQAKMIVKAHEEADRLRRKIDIERNILLVRSHILKARMELSLKNLDTARKELDLASERFTKAGLEKIPAWKESVEGIQAGFRKAKMEIDLNLPAAIQRIDLLWHDLDLAEGAKN